MKKKYKRKEKHSAPEDHPSLAFDTK